MSTVDVPADDTAGRYISAINDRIGDLEADLRSYVYLRAQPAWNAGGHGLGGGNLLCTLASFALLGVLAKVVYAVRRPKKFTLVSNVDANVCSACRKGPRLHEVNETAAFASFIKWLGTTGIKLGIDTSNAEAIWSEYRNWLVHRFDTKHIVATVSFKNDEGTPRTTEDVERLLAEGKKAGAMTAIMKMGDQWAFVVDIFYMDLPALRDAITGLLRADPLSPESVEVLDDLLLGIEPPVQARV